MSNRGIVKNINLAVMSNRGIVKNMKLVVMKEGNADSVELFDHLYISRRNLQNDRFRVYHLIRGSFFTNTIIYVYQF